MKKARKVKPKSKEVIISFPVSAEWKARLDKELKRFGVLADRYEDFYRGAIEAAIGNALYPHGPGWQKFQKAVQPLAMKFLGVGVHYDGLDTMLDIGKYPPEKTIPWVRRSKLPGKPGVSQ